MGGYNTRQMRCLASRTYYYAKAVFFGLLRKLRGTRRCTVGGNNKHFKIHLKIL
jgi:hypothetical protein